MTDKDPWSWLFDQQAHVPDLQNDPWKDIPWQIQGVARDFLQGTPYSATHHRYPSWAKMSVSQRCNLWVHLFVKHPFLQNDLLEFWQEKGGFLSSHPVTILGSSTAQKIKTVEDVLLSFCVHAPCSSQNPPTSTQPLYIVKWIQNQDNLPFHQRVWDCTSSVWGDLTNKANRVCDDWNLILKATRHAPQSSVFLNILPSWFARSQKTPDLFPFWKQAWSEVITRPNLWSFASDALREIAVSLDHPNKKQIYDALSNSTNSTTTTSVDKTSFAKSIQPRPFLERNLWFSWWDITSSFGLTPAQAMDEHEKEVLFSCCQNINDLSMLQQIHSNMSSQLQDKMSKEWALLLWKEHRLSPTQQRLPPDTHPETNFRMKWNKMLQVTQQNLPLVDIDSYVLLTPKGFMTLTPDGKVQNRSDTPQIRDRLDEIVTSLHDKSALIKAVGLAPLDPDPVRTPRKM